MRRSRSFLSRWRASFWAQAVSGFISILLIDSLALGAMPIPTDKPANYPAWWFADGVIQPNNPANASPLWQNHDYPPADDYSAVNAGQLKNIATKAYQELQNKLPGGAGDMSGSQGTGYQLNQLISGWQTAEQNPAGTADDYTAINLGQVKAVAKLFYDRLKEIGYTDAYPWAQQALPADDWAMANLGQVKYLFSFDLTKDSNGDGIPDWWEQFIRNNMPAGNAPPAPLPNGGNTVVPPVYGTPSPGSGGDGPTIDPDHYIDINSGNLYWLTLWVAADPGGTGTTADLSWDYLGTSHEVHIQRMDGTGSWNDVTTITDGSSEYPDTGLLANVTYNYRIYVVFDNATPTFSATVEYHVPFVYAWQYDVNPGIYGYSYTYYVPLWAEFPYVIWYSNAYPNAPWADISELFWNIEVDYLPLVNPSADSSAMYVNVFAPNGSADSPYFVTDTYTVTSGVAPSVYYDAGNGSQGSYVLMPGVELNATGFNPLAGIINTLDPHQKNVGTAIIRPGGPPGTFAFTEWVQGAEYKVSIDNTDDFTVSNGSGPMADGTIFTGDEKQTTLQFQVTANPIASTGDKVTITVSGKDAEGHSLGSDAVIFTAENPPPQFDLSQTAPSRYRKIGLNGRPLPDEKPQQTPESDQEKEETYIDAYTLTLHHSTTDVYVPLPGSDLPLQARRNSQSEIWNMYSGFRPHERMDRPFGAGWTSNLCVYLEFNSENSVTVSDQNGTLHQFGGILNSTTQSFDYVILPSATRENGDYNSTLSFANGGAIFTDRYGTQISFDMSNMLQKEIVLKAFGNVSVGQYAFHRAKTIQDRYGNTLTYSYPDNTSDTLIPSTITFSGASTGSGAPPALQTLSIEQSAGGYVTRIWDPNGNPYLYTYAALPYEIDGFSSSEEVLTSVTGPDGTVTHYEYGFDIADDLMPHGLDVPPADTAHLDVTKITDANNNSYAFTYLPDRTIMNYDLASEQYYPMNGAEACVVGVTLPGSLGSTTFSLGDSKIEATVGANGYELSADSNRTVTVTDAAGNVINYTWSGAKVFGLAFNDPSASAAGDASELFFTSMKIAYASGSETYTFDPAAGMALTSIKDFSGNVTTFTYGDDYNPPLPQGNLLLVVLPNSGFGVKYADPTTQTNALNDAKTFHYSSNFRIMDSVTDENGHTKTYQVDTSGRRLNEIVYTGDTTSAVLQETDFAYGSATFPGVVTKKTVRNLGGPGAPTWATDLVTQYVLDDWGRVQQEIVDPAGLALTTTYTYDHDGNKLSVTDPRNNTTSFQYDLRNRLIKTVFADGSARTIDYYSNGKKKDETDENGHVTTYVYDAMNRPLTKTRTVASGNIVTTLGYTDAVSPKTSVTDPNGNQTRMQYDSMQRLITTTDPLGNVTSYDYSGGNSGGTVFDSSGFKPTQVTDPRNYVTTNTYDGLYHLIGKSVQYQLTSALSAATTIVCDDLGNPTNVTDPNGNQTTTDFDALNRPFHIKYADATETYTHYTSTGLKWEVQDELGNVTETQYDSAGRAVKVLSPAVDDGLDPGNAGRTGHLQQPTTQTQYDGAGNVIATINPLNREWDYVFDVRNRKIEEDQPSVIDGTNGQAARPVIRTGYDYVGNTLWVQDARGYTIQTAYDEANRPVLITEPKVLLAGGTDAVQPTTSKTYDANGNVLTATDENGHVTTNTYDALNHLQTTLDAANITVSYGFDEVGNRTSVTDGLNHATTFAYDGLNRITTTTDAAGNVTTLAYDGVNKTSRTDALGQVTNYGYDARNRLTGITYPARAADNRTYGYDAAGNLLSVSEPGKGGVANVGYTYDALKRVLTETSNGATHTYRYDLAGNRLGAQYGLSSGGNGRLLISSYDALNRLSTIADYSSPTATTFLTTTYAYDLGGNAVSKILPNGDTVSMWYDGRKRVYEQEGTSTGGVIYHYLSLCDAAGNLSTSTEYTAGLPKRTVTLGYDAADRLTGEVVSDVNGATVTTTSYDYDAANNRAHKTVNGVVTTYTCNTLNELTGWSDTAGHSATYGYDANGNRATRTAGGATDTYSYDTENRLVNLTKNTPPSTLNSTHTVTGTYGYVYDYRTRRVTRTESGYTTQLAFSGGTSVQEYYQPSTSQLSTNNYLLSAEYVRGSDWGGGVGGILYSVRDGAPSFAHYNRRGDVITHTNATGAVTWQASYEAGGTRTAEMGTTQDRQKGNTKEEDPTGLLNEGMRYRDLETDTFITCDPAGFVDGPNRYAYVRQNPWSEFDAQGLDLTTAGTGLLVYAGSAAGESAAVLALPVVIGAVFAAGIWGLKDHVPPPNGGIYVPPGATDCNSGYQAPRSQGDGIDYGHAFTIHTQDDADAYSKFLTGNQSDPLRAHQELRDYLNSKPSTDGSSPESSAKSTTEESQGKVPNPWGSPGKPDHQDAVKDLMAEKALQYPASDGYTIETNTSIKDAGVNRRPDVTVRDKDGNVVEVCEVARTNKDGTLVSREQKKQQEYQDAGIPSTVKTLPPSTPGDSPTPTNQPATPDQPAPPQN